MQHRVGGAFERRYHRDGVLECLHRQNVRWFDAASHQLCDCRASLVCILALALAHGFLRGGVRQRQPKSLDGGGHRVGRVHAGAGAWAWNGGLLYRQKLFVADGAGGVAADGLEHRHDIAPLLPGLDGAAIDEDGWPVQPRHGHRAGWHVLVATADRDEAVEPLRAHHGLDGVGDHFPRHQGVAHPRRAHRDAVRDGDGVEQDALGAGLVGTHRRRIREFVDVHVARRHHRPGGGNAHLRLGEILAGKAHGIEHGAARCLLHTVDDDGGVGAFGIGHGDDSLADWRSVRRKTFELRA